MRAKLLRFADSPQGVFGFLDLENHAGIRVARFATAEEEWRNNQRSVSCIPAGLYTCRRTRWLKHDLETFEITEVPGRTRILFHPGNTVADTEGCILVGKDFGAVPVQDVGTERLRWAVLRSREAFREFMDYLDGVEMFLLEIRWSAPGEWRYAE
ncbi:MAG TPA: DUF5675 family protein [Gemmatimonadales bacterium]|nr:DUF5675 family protein [Gemmatimonadales bacterium]